MNCCAISYRTPWRSCIRTCFTTNANAVRKVSALSRDWLKARLHFRVGNPGHPTHCAPAPLLVWNDDEVAPRSGFALHSHRDTETVTVCAVSRPEA